MTVAIIRFGGSNCDRDVHAALTHLGIDAEIIWHEDALPDHLDGIVIPGGFSYGDYLRAGAMAAHSPIMDAVRAAAAGGLPVLGICNGAQIGAEAGLVDGAFTDNATGRFRCDHVHVRVETTASPFTTAYADGAILRLPIAHGAGRFVADAATVEHLETTDRVLLRYCTPDGEITAAANPNGSAANIAGVLGEQRTVAVTMPHPERATLPALGSTDGQGLLGGFGQPQPSPAAEP